MRFDGKRCRDWFTWGGFFPDAFLNPLYLLHIHLSYLMFGGNFPVYWIRKELLERERCVVSVVVCYTGITLHLIIWRFA